MAMTVAGLERRLTALLDAFLGATLLAMLLVIVVLVVMRYGFQSGLVGANETATMAFVYVSSLGAAVAIGRDEHVRVNFLAARLGARPRAHLQSLAAVLVGVLNLTLLFGGMAWIAETGHTPMPVTQVPRVVLQASIPIGCGLAVLFCVTRLVALRRDGARR